MSVVIIGAGQAGVQAADSLRAGGYTRPITVVSAEAGAPYQRPPLSKDHLAAEHNGQSLPLRPDSFFGDGAHQVHLLDHRRVDHLDRDRRTVVLAADTDAQQPVELGYEHLIVATGARHRELNLPGEQLAGVHRLRTHEDAATLREALAPASRVVMVGSGFIGLEIAAGLRARGIAVTVLSPSDRVMRRSVSEATSRWFEHTHTQAGIDLRLGEGAVSLRDNGRGRVDAVVSTSGEVYPADVVVVATGVTAEDSLARASGLVVDDGIVVDHHLRTSDPHIFAIGDCARFPAVHHDGLHRVESVQNATDQGRHVAEVILGEREPYKALPWFWSVQGGYRLQMAGISAGCEDTVVTGNPDTGKFAVLCFREDHVVAVETVNMAGEHLAARKLLAAGVPIHRNEVDETFSLRAASKALTAALV